MTEILCPSVLFTICSLAVEGEIPMARTMFKRRPRDNTIVNERRRKMKERAAESRRLLVDMALKHFHESKNETGAEYELVRDLSGGAVRYGFDWFLHINFLAKPKGAPENEVKLFFAEIRTVFSASPIVISCSILGPEGTVTGAGGCKSCDREGELPPEKVLAQHPLDGKFTRGLYANFVIPESDS